MKTRLMVFLLFFFSASAVALDTSTSQADVPQYPAHQDPAEDPAQAATHKGAPNSASPVTPIAPGAYKAAPTQTPTNQEKSSQSQSAAKSFTEKHNAPGAFQGAAKPKPDLSVQPNAPVGTPTPVTPASPTAASPIIPAQ
jgi:hypothetical protein